MKKDSTISQRILLLLFLSMATAILIFSILYTYKNIQEKEISRVSLKQFTHEVNSIISLHEASLKQVVFDYTYWDEFVENIKPHNENWFEHNITTIVGSFHFDYAGVYNNSKALLHESFSEGFQPDTITTASALNFIHKNRFADYFRWTSDGLVSISAATIHGTNDPFHTRTPVSGYFILAKRWDNALLKELSTMLGADIRLIKPGDKISADRKYSLSVSRDMLDYNKQPIAKLIITREFPVLKLYDTISLYSLGVILLMIIVALIIFYYTSNHWILKPLQIVGDILETENPKSLDALKKNAIEFKRIGLLFDSYMEQKAELVKAREKAEESDRLKSAFLANISHEIRTPMNGILGFTELLRDNTLDLESRMEYLSIIDKSGRQLLNLINDIIDISKIEAGLMHIQPVDCSLNKIFRETAMMFNSSSKIRNKEIELRLKLQFSDEASWVRIDPMRLSQVLTNLVGNAIKFTQKGSVDFGYRLSTDNQLLVYCRDTGIGIPADKQKAIFDRFIQVNNTSSRPYEGTGLGLAISQSLTELMEGRMWVESEPGKGSIFYLSLPFIPVDRGTSDIFTSEITIEVPNLAGKLILVAEDIPVNFQFLKATLEKTGAEIVWAQNGNLAVERALTEPHPDLILMDLKMPEMNGYEATKLIKEQFPGIPIVAQTAYSLDGDKLKSIEAGCDEHIAKPIQTNELYQILSSLLKPLG